MRAINKFEIAILSREYANKFINDQIPDFLPIYIIDDGSRSIIFLINYTKIFYA